ncbi:MAG: surface-adhesin E family protein [Sphingomonas sp.]
MRWWLTPIAILPFVPIQASAQSWYRVGGNDRTYSYLDLESLAAKDGKVRATLLSTYAHAIGDAKVSAAQVTVEYDCAGHSFRTIEYTYFGTARDVLGTEPSETIDQWKTPVAGSIDESSFKFACTRTGGTKVADPFSDGYFGQK